MLRKKTIKIKPKKKAAQTREKRGQKTPQVLRGMKDILPSEQKYWEFIRGRIEKIAPIYGFTKIETPVLEETALFKRAVGEDTDIVDKELFSFTDQGGDLVSMRPEFTASVARAYIEHGLFNRPQPLKFWYLGPVFRYGRPQAGRLRQFNQFGVEVLGSADSVIDAQLIILAYFICQELKLKVDVQVNSIGCLSCRGEYKKILISYLRTKKSFLCGVCQERLTKNPLRILDCKEEECRKLLNGVPPILDYLCEACKNHFIKVLEGLDEVGVPYSLNSFLVRGLDYYNRTVFEIWPAYAPEGASAGRSAYVEASPLAKATADRSADDKPADAKVSASDEAMLGKSSDEELKEEDKESDPSSLALGGGGRYDGLIEILGGRPTPGAGFSLGLERLILIMKKQGISVPELNRNKFSVFVAQLGEPAKKVSLKLFEILRKGKIKVAENFSKDGLRSQLELADKLGVKYTLIVGQREILNKTIIIRDMESGVQENIDFDKILLEIKKRLK